VRKIDKLWIESAKEWTKEKQADIKENNIIIDNVKKMMLVCNSKLKALQKQNSLIKKMIQEQDKIIKKTEKRK